MSNLLITLLILITLSLAGQTPNSVMNKNNNTVKTEEQWKQELTTEQYNVLRNCGTEPPFTGKYYKHDEQGIYYCAACGARLFSSDSKYNSGSGWPSFYEAMDKKAVTEVVDNSFGMKRIEIKCASCNSHLGHVFPDGPQPTGLRFCVNSTSLDFKKSSESKKD